MAIHIIADHCMSFQMAQVYMVYMYMHIHTYMAINLMAALTRRILSYRPTYLLDDIAYVVRAVPFQLYVYQAHTCIPASTHTWQPAPWQH